MSNSKEHKRFCESDGWQLYKQTDHYYFRKVLPNGEVVKTMVTMGKKEYSPSLFQRILKQLRVTKEEFNKKYKYLVRRSYLH